MADKNYIDPTDIRAQERATAQREEEQRFASNQEAEDLKWLMADKRGRRVMWGLLEKTGCFRNPFTGNSETFFKCGEMNIGQKYLSLVNEHCPEKYNLMVTEQNNARSTKQRRK